MKESQYGPCGLYCGACGATDCGGCHSDLIDDSIRQCRFRQYAMDKGIEFCCFCGEYPCEGLDRFMHDQWPHHWTMEPNLEYIRQHGRDAWLRAQKEQWSCPGCHAEVKWYQQACPCGRQLDAWALPQ